MNREQQLYARLIGLAVMILGAFLLPVSATSSAPKFELWPRWRRHDPASSQRIDHGPWNLFTFDFYHRQPRRFSFSRLGHVKLHHLPAPYSRLRRSARP